VGAAKTARPGAGQGVDHLQLPFGQVAVCLHGFGAQLHHFVLQFRVGDFAHQQVANTGIEPLERSRPLALVRGEQVLAKIGQNVFEVRRAQAEAASGMHAVKGLQFQHGIVAICQQGHCQHTGGCLGAVGRVRAHGSRAFHH